MYIWPDDMELLLLNGAGDRLSLKSTFNTNLAFGDMGSGKTSGFGAHLLIALLRVMAGGYLPCPKPTDYRDYMKHIRFAGREQDVILMRPTANWNDTPINCLNVLDLELNRFGRGTVNIANVTALLMKVTDLIQRQSGHAGSNDAFWRSYAEKIIKAGLTAQSIVMKRIDLKLLLKFVNELPNSFSDTEERSHYSVALMREAKEVFGESAPFDFMLHYNFVMREWPQTPPNARGSGSLTVQVLLTTLLSHPLRQMLFEGTSFDLDQALNRQGILLLDMNVHDYAQGAIAGMILKDVIQRACQNRSELSNLEPQFIQPVFELVDEYPNYAVDEDELHSLMARGARSIPIYIAQSYPAVLARFLNKEKAESQLEVPGCRWIHQTGSMKTAKWMADTIGEVLVERKGRQTGKNWNYGAGDQHGRNEGENYTLQKEHECPPRAFTRLLRGGPENKLRTEAIFWRSGEKFRLNDCRYLPVCFPQDFRPGRDEVLITANPIVKGGDNHASQHKSLVPYSASQDGWKRLRSFFR
jgi:hypothetical protein